jgi:HK97 family phage portal protein
MLKRVTQAFLNKISGFSKKESAVASLIASQHNGRPVWTPRRYDSLSEQGYLKNVIVYRCVNIISRSIASVPWKLSMREKELLSHPLLTLLHHPNPRQGGASFIEAVLSYLLLSGNSYIEAIAHKEESPLELHPLRPDRIKIIPGPGGVPASYEYSVAGKGKVLKVDSLSGFSHVLHLKLFHPLNDWYGMSPLEAAAISIDQHNQVSSHNLSLLQNGARPSGAMVIGSKNGNSYLTQEQKERLKQDLENAYRGTSNAGQFLLLEGDFEWKEMGLSPKDLDFVTGKNLSAREIAQAYGVPAMLVGVPGDATFANYKEARYHLWEETILPFLDYLTDELNAWLVPQFGSGLRLYYDIDGIPALSARRYEAWRKVQNVNFLTINEKREALGYPPITGGDMFETRTFKKPTTEKENGYVN